MPAELQRMLLTREILDNLPKTLPCVLLHAQPRLSQRPTFQLPIERQLPLQPPLLQVPARRSNGHDVRAFSTQSTTLPPSAVFVLRQAFYAVFLRDASAKSTVMFAVGRRNN
mmetsp:Transcript_21093/g.58115  ORF Transcript_21093/g.58115 Transcript_21093/m.58115 type:complete len:112 (+) Transcript_21093:566-901(+)